MNSFCVNQPEAAIDREMAVLMLDLAKAVTWGRRAHRTLRFGPYRLRADRADTRVCVQVVLIRGGLPLVCAQLHAKDLMPAITH